VRSIDHHDARYTSKVLSASKLAGVTFTFPAKASKVTIWSPAEPVIVVARSTHLVEGTPGGCTLTVKVPAVGVAEKKIESWW
jgi:hypothetical protein